MFIFFKISKYNSYFEQHVFYYEQNARYFEQYIRYFEQHARYFEHNFTEHKVRCSFEVSSTL